MDNQTTPITYPYINFYNNGNLTNQAKTTGKNVSRIRHSSAKLRSQNETAQLAITGGGLIAIDLGIMVQLISPDTKKEIGRQKKDSRSSLYPAAEKICFFSSGLLTVKTTKNFDQFNDEDAWFVNYLGGGGYSEVLFFSMDEEVATLGIHLKPRPRDLPGEFIFLQKHYKQPDLNWELRFSTYSTPPVLSKSKNILFPEPEGLKVISLSGEILTSIPVKGFPLSVSCSDAGDIAAFYRQGRKTFLQLSREDGKLLWNTESSLSNLNQPPVTGKKQQIYLIGKSLLEAYFDGEKRWEYELGNSAGSQLATLLPDGTLLVADDNTVFALNPDGKLLWTYKDKKKLSFRTLPVTCSQGKIYVATDEEIIILS